MEMPQITRREMRNQGDEQLVWAARMGVEDAFAELVRRHYERCLRVSTGILGNRELAQDAVQDAFFRAHRRLARFEGTSSFYTWLYRIVVNASIDTIRGNRRRRTACLEDDRVFENLQSSGELWPRFEHHHPERHYERGELRERLERAFAGLGDIHRDVLALRELEGQSYEEIADVLSIKKGTVMSRLFHARRCMQRELAGLTNAPADVEPTLEDAVAA